ncbi:MAG: N-acetylmuramoyl-L-alanine amidase [Melioribacteraceae bacterium]
MKKHLGYFALIIMLATACSTIVDVAKKETVTKSKSFQYYKDKILFLNFENENLTESDTIKNKIADGITAAAKQNFDAVIFNANNLSKSLLTSSIAELTFINILRFAGDLAHSNGLDFFIEINFSELNRSTFPPFRNMIIKNNINMLVKNCEFDGFYFSGINLSSKDDNDLFEDIVVECMMLKPFLIVSISSKLSDAETQLVDKYVEKGIIDFLFDDELGYLIKYNKFITVNENEKILKNYLKRFSPDHFITLNLSEVIDKNDTDAIILNENKTKQINHGKKLSFILTGKSDSLKLKIGNNIYNISTSDWVIPYNYLLKKDNTVSRYETWVEFRRPFANITSNDFYNLLCKTKYPSKVFINNDSVKIYKTGIFFKKIKLKDGLNKLRAEVKEDNGETVIYEDRVLFQKKDPSTMDLKLAINDNSIEPVENITLMPEDYLTVSFNGTKSQKGFVEIIPGGFTFECFRTDYSGSSQYKIQIPLKNFSHDQKYSIKLILKAIENNSTQNSVEKILNLNLSVKDYSDFPTLTTISDNSILTFTLAPIRLGAPVRSELPKNVILKSNGIFGENYRVHLSDSEEGYINREFVKELPATSIIPSYFINPISSYPTDSADIIKIPYLESVPYDIYPDPGQKRIIINLYGVKTSSTWIIHRNNLRYVDKITWQQTSKETYKIYVNLNTSKIWGYDLKQNGKELIFRIKYPPTYNLETNLPLKGIKFSLEAGHGGSNLGAVGLSGLKEKEINLKLCKMLESLLRKYGAEVLQVRDSDKDMTLIEKRDLVTNSDANIHLSIHANSSEPTNEFLGTSGTCTFYHNPFWAPLAEKIYHRLIELDLKPFGSVGSFNYRVTRMSDIPAILVEQAFMSHAEDEEKLYDDNFRQQMAEKIYNGILDYLKFMKD